jgi:NAD(P)-dependent dehydrogenase (short-subunit alcohol dehydrogenase family)
MFDRLKDKAIIVVGAGSGIGASTVRRLAAEGAHVAVADINLPAAETVAQSVVDTGGRAFAVAIDIADEAAVTQAFGEALDRLGRLDGAHINAADLRVIFGDSDALDEELAVFDRTHQVNLRGHLLCTRAALPHLLASGEGAIVYTSSGACDAGDSQRPAYASAKAGLNALMRHVAQRWGAEGVTANCVAPGFTITPEMAASGMLPDSLVEGFLKTTPHRRVGKVEDISAMVALLLSREGAWINGQVIHINGGSLMR